MYAEQGNRHVNWSDYIPSLIASSERKVFENLVLLENRKREIGLLKDRSNNLTLFPWQLEVIRTISEEDSDRSVFWVEDEVGGAGKSVLARYIVGCENAALFHDFDYRNNSFLYDKENVVVFDLPRSYVPSNMTFVEDLKNGHVMSMKYEPVRKIFDSPTIIIFSNNPPPLQHLSMDRWRLLGIGTNELGEITVTRSLGFSD